MRSVTGAVYAREGYLRSAGSTLSNAITQFLLLGKIASVNITWKNTQSERAALAGALTRFVRGTSTASCVLKGCCTRRHYTLDAAA